MHKFTCRDNWIHWRKKGNEEKVSPNLMETATLKIAKKIGDLQPCEKGKICLYMVLVQRAIAITKPC